MAKTNKTHKELTELISTITSDRKKESEKYEGFEIISDSLDTTLTKQQLIQALDVMWTIVMTADKKERDDKYLFGRGLLTFNETYKKDKGESMSKEQYDKMVYKVENIRPLMEFLIKMREVIK